MLSLPLSAFQNRHIGISKDETLEMLQTIGVNFLDTLIDETVPDSIRMSKDLDIPNAQSEFEYLKGLKKIASKNKVYKSYIGQGYYGCITPSVILRNVFQNPGWYTQYTPYQAEIAQGRLEALLNFQTMVADLTGLPIANASLLDEGTAAAEAMSMFRDIRNKKRKDNPARKFFIDECVFAQTIDIMYTRAEPLGIEIVVGAYSKARLSDNYIGALVQFPNANGDVTDYRAFIEKCNAAEILVCVASDLMSMVLLSPPGEWGADVVVGNSQRFGVPMGYGGPHAAFFATKEAYKRLIPGRIIGVSQDSNGDDALRMALQTREQHIKREKATSNICTAQALLAVMAGMYAVYHGPDGLKDIALQIHKHTAALANGLEVIGLSSINKSFFDTLTFEAENEKIDNLRNLAEKAGINFFYKDDSFSISVDETTTDDDVDEIVELVSHAFEQPKQVDKSGSLTSIPEKLWRSSPFMQHPVFSSNHTETKMMRYIKSLENKDLSLVHSMIALGSCTMKLNAASELIPVSWSEFANIHPFAPLDQTEGYQQIFEELSQYLCEITGFAACSLQPNSGAQGEYAGLMTIAAYHSANGNNNRKIALIPSSAHGTNPASAVMAGMNVVVVKCDERGNIDVEDLRAKCEKHSDVLAALMVTYPSTHGVFETAIIDICKMIHDHGGLVYMDGANMNAQVGLTSPGIIGADVCHLNLHKTFAIPHGGGGPGMGPICVNEKLKPFLPGHPLIKTGGDQAIRAISAAPWGSASILLISYGYIRMLGKQGLIDSTKYAILNANYMKARLEGHYPVLYTGEKGRAAHEMILDLRQFKSVDISAEDVAKRLIDYGFHAPTLSFPVAGTIMIEPTESEDKAELDRFCDALISIKKEIQEIEKGKADKKDNVLQNAPHTLKSITVDDWKRPYKRSKAAYPLPYLYQSKFWSTVGRVDNAYGDRNLICTCPPIESYEEGEVV
jgi:glycine dehydrogenase